VYITLQAMRKRVRSKHLFKMLIFAGSALLLLLLTFLFSLRLHDARFDGKKNTVLSVKDKRIKNTPTPQQKKKQIISPKVTPPLMQNTPKLLFGLGSEADSAVKSRLVQEAPVRMLTSWYNGSHDLPWMSGWKDTLIPQLYFQGYTLHLIVFSDLPEGELPTNYGTACGRAYPLSARFLEDMKILAETFAGSGPLYVTLFTEFQTYPCQDNQWVGSENYYKALKDQYRVAKNVFHQYAPNSNVAFSWGGWQSRWNDPGNGGGQALFPYFSDILSESDFSAFQAMESGTNTDDILQMTKILGKYKRPVMLAHYKPDNGSQQTYDNDVHTIFTDTYLRELTSNGLFAFSFMDEVNLSSETSYQFVRNSVTRYSSSPILKSATQQ